MVTSLSWRSAIVVLSRSLAPASSSRGRLTWFIESVVHTGFGRILCLLRSDWSLRWLNVCIGTDASEKEVAFALREGCRELSSEVGRVSERTTFKTSSRSIRARSRALGSIAPDVVLECSSSDEDEMSLDEEGSRKTS